MSLKSTSLPKKYRDGKVLYEQSLDLWRQETERAIATINLNFTQLRKDCFLSNYDYDNDGNANLETSLQGLINNVASGIIPVTGTTSDFWIINTDGNSSTLTTVGLTADRSHTLPDATGTLALLELAQTFTSAQTFNIAYIGGGTVTDSLIKAPILVPGQVQNLSITKSGGTITIASADGTALSDVNPAWVCMPSAVTPGTNVTLAITANIEFNDDDNVSSHLSNIGFGITETAHWASDMPFFVYLVNEDDDSDNVGLFISRNPCYGTTPAATHIHDKTYDPAIAETQDSIFGAWDAAESATKATKPCILIGAIRMRWSTTTDDWTVQALGNNDGIGEDKLNKTFATTWVMPAGQNGAAASKYFADNGGTAPGGWTNQVMVYHVGRDGNVDLNFNFSTGDPNGAGAVPLELVIPLSHVYSSGIGGLLLGTIRSVGSVVCLVNGKTGLITACYGSSSLNSYALNFIHEGDNLILGNGDLNDNGDAMYGTIRYRAFAPFLTW